MKNKYIVSLSSHAQKDLNQIYSYIAADSPNNARTFINQLEQRIFSLESLPEMHPLIPENNLLKTSYRHLIFKKYRIIFRITGCNVYIS